MSRSSDDDDDDAGVPPYDEIDEIPTLLFSNSHEEHLDFDLILLSFWCFVTPKKVMMVMGDDDC